MRVRWGEVGERWGRGGGEVGERWGRGGERWGRGGGEVGVICGGDMRG